jgi:YD repeat-containing protein
VYPNKGTTFGEQQVWPLGDSTTCQTLPGLDVVVSASAKYYFQGSDSSSYIGIKQSLVDFNGDGYLELLSAPLSVSSVTNDIYFIRYQKDRQTGAWAFDLPGLSEPCDVHAHMCEWVSIPKSYKDRGVKTWVQTAICSLSADGQPCHRVRQVQSGSGVTTALSYGLPETAQMPFPAWAVTVHDRHDVATDVHRTTFIESSNPVYDAVRREFRGFALVQEDMGAGPTLRVTHEFRQGEYDQGVEVKTSTYTIPADPREGPPTLVQSITRTPLTETYSVTGRRWTRIKDEWTTVFDPGGFQRDTLRMWDHDIAHGLITELRTKGDPAGLDERVDRYEYEVVDTPELYVVREKRRARMDHVGVLSAETKWLYDGQCADAAALLTQGKACSETVWRGNGAPAAETLFAYDTLGRLESVKDPDKIPTTITYVGDSAHEATRTDALGHLVTYAEHDAISGEAGLVCGPQKDTAGNARCDRTTFDAYGRPTQVKKGLLPQGAATYTMAVVSEIEYFDTASAGKPRSVRATQYPDHLDSTPKRVTEINYDGDGRVIRIGQTVHGGWSGRYFGYDWFGNLSRALLPVAEAPGAGYQPPAALQGPHCRPACIAGYTYWHDALQRPVRSQNPSGESVEVKYRGPEIWIQDARTYVTRYGLSTFDDIVSREQTVKGTSLKESFKYDSSGRLSRATDADLAEYGYVYYGDGSLYRADLPGGSWTYTRTPGGRLQKTVTPDGATIELVLDAIGRPATRTVTPGKGACSGGQPLVEQYSYDSDSTQIGRLTGLSQRGWKLLAMHYDAQGNLDEKSLSAPGLPSLSYMKQFNALNEIVGVGFPSGRTVSVGYDEAGLVRTLTGTSPGALSATIDYALDGKPAQVDGRLTSAEETAVAYAESHS